MTVSLAFHILFAVAGMAMPLLMLIAGVLHHTTKDRIYDELARRWAKGTAILFAVGAVSGTVLSFELGLLWPGFMAKAGPMVGLPFSLEGFAFFLEAIFLGLYLYGRNRLSRGMHLLSAAIIALSGLASGVFVMAVNAWMQTPTGFTLGANGEFESIDPWGAFRSASFPTQASHMAFAAYSSVAAAVLGIHAFGLSRNPESLFHRRAAKIALGALAVSMPLQILSGDFSAKHLAEHQPIKLAAAEALFSTSQPASLSIGGWPDVEKRELKYAIEVPYALSILAFGDPNAEVLGLDNFDQYLWPNIPIMHVAFQIMVGCGFAMLALAGAGVLLAALKRDLWRNRWFLRACMAVGPLGLIAVEAGWVVTECGRQPWIIRGLLHVKDAVSPMPGLVWPFLAITVLYLFLGVVVLVMLRAHVFKVEEDAQ